MNLLPASLLSSELRTKSWDRARQKKRGFRGSGIRGLTARDNIFSALKAAAQHYGMHSDAEHSAGLVIGMIGIENMNIEYLAAALYLYNTYREAIPEQSTNKAENITPEMFLDKTTAMTRIRARLEGTSRSGVAKRDLWPERKTNILTYFYSIMLHLSGNNGNFKPSEAYKRFLDQEEEEEAENEAEALEAIEEDADPEPEPELDDVDEAEFASFEF